MSEIKIAATRRRAVHFPIDRHETPSVHLWQDSKHDNRVRGTLIERYQHLVKITAGRYVSKMPPSVERDDIIGVGMEGLIKAVDQFDPTRKIKFETYAISLIRGAILESLREEDWVPRSVRDFEKKYASTYLQLEEVLGRSPSLRELAMEMSVEPDKIREHHALMERAFTYSLESPVSYEDTNTTLSDTIRDDETDVFEQVQKRNLQEVLGRAIERLPEREQRVITYYYGEGITFREIGKRIGVSESRVYQLHTQAIARLRKAGALREYAVPDNDEPYISPVSVRLSNGMASISTSQPTQAAKPEKIRPLASNYSRSTSEPQQARLRPIRQKAPPKAKTAPKPSPKPITVLERYSFLTEKLPSLLVGLKHANVHTRTDLMERIQSNLGLSKRSADRDLRVFLNGSIIGKRAERGVIKPVAICIAQIAGMDEHEVYAEFTVVSPTEPKSSNRRTKTIPKSGPRGKQATPLDEYSLLTARLPTLLEGLKHANISTRADLVQRVQTSLNLSQRNANDGIRSFLRGNISYPRAVRNPIRPVAACVAQIAGVEANKVYSEFVIFPPLEQKQRNGHKGAPAKMLSAYPFMAIEMPKILAGLNAMDIHTAASLLEKVHGELKGEKPPLRKSVHLYLKYGKIYTGYSHTVLSPVAISIAKLAGLDGEQAYNHAAAAVSAPSAVTTEHSQQKMALKAPNTASDSCHGVSLRDYPFLTDKTPALLQELQQIGICTAEGLINRVMGDLDCSNQHASKIVRGFLAGNILSRNELSIAAKIIAFTAGLSEYEAYARVRSPKPYSSPPLPKKEPGIRKSKPLDSYPFLRDQTPLLLSCLKGAGIHTRADFIRYMVHSLEIGAHNANITAKRFFEGDIVYAQASLSGTLKPTAVLAAKLANLEPSQAYPYLEVATKQTLASLSLIDKPAPDGLATGQALTEQSFLPRRSENYSHTTLHSCAPGEVTLGCTITGNPSAVERVFGRLANAGINFADRKVKTTPNL